MTSKAGEGNEFYEENFDPEAYIEVIKPVREDEGTQDAWDFMYASLENVFKNPRIRGKTMLDIGSGPTVHNLIPACLYYSHIVLSDLVESNRKALEKWLKNDPDALDWSPHITKAVKIHGYTDMEKGKSEVEDLIRRNVKAVIYCDILADKIIPDPYHVPYDLVLSSLTLESAAPDYPAFKKSIKNINPLVKLGGFLILKGFTTGTTWECGNSTFPYLKVTMEQINEALEDAGFGETEWQTKKRHESITFYDFDSSYCLCCTKLREITI